jgi:asparagine synthase (glutamine-hydrolysing)
MTALAAFWGEGPPGASSACRDMLEAQAIYGREPAAVAADGDAAIGRKLHACLPQDRFDPGPLTGGGGAWRLVADIRIDNRTELAAALGLEAERSLSDSALLLAALERWDVAPALGRVVGDFAFILWQSDRRRLILARDFLGQRPLHYHVGRAGFAAASMPKGLHAWAAVPREPDLDEAAAFLALLPEDPERSFFAGIRKVRPGHVLTVGSRGIESRPWWSPDLSPVELGGSGAYEEALRAALEQAVRARLRGAEGAVGAHLSAGLDSSTVAATAARLLAAQGSEVFGFTAVPRPGFAGTGLRRSLGNEGPAAAAVAALHPNLRHVPIESARLSPVRNLDRNFLLYDRPVFNLCNQSWADEINEAARGRGLAILLTGQRGNMGLSYSGMAFLPQALRRGRFGHLARTALELSRNGVRWGTIAAQTLGPLLPRPLWLAVARARRKGIRVLDHSLLTEAAAQSEAFARSARERGLDSSYRPWSDGQKMRLWALRGIDGGNYNKGVLGGWGIDMRDPTADRRLIELCLRIPEERFLAGGRPRGLVRRAFADRLPPEVLDQTVKGYQAADWYEGLASARAELEAEAARLAALPETNELIDVGAMRRLLQDWPQQGWDSEPVMRRYRLALLRAVSTGHFIRRALGVG